MAKKITIQLSGESIKAAIKEIARYKKWVDDKTKLLCERLAIIGAREATVRFSGAYYTDENDTVIDVFPYSVVETHGSGYIISASGTALFFIEFGAGVYYNGAEPYPLPRPKGVSKIGEYGQGKGKQDTWGYYRDGNKDDLVITHGTPAAMPMYHATQEMQRELTRVVREVFRSG
jgi:hypothetical protein